MPADKKTVATRALQTIQDVLAILEPKDVLTIHAASGRAYEIRTSLPARRQIRALRWIEEAVEAAWKTKVEPKEAGDASGRILALLKEAMGNEEILLKVARAFREAYPDVVKKEAEACDILNEPDVAADLFPVEALIDSLLPLFARLVAKALEAMKAMNQANQSPEIQPEN